MVAAWDKSFSWNQWGKASTLGAWQGLTMAGFGFAAGSLAGWAMGHSLLGSTLAGAAGMGLGSMAGQAAQQAMGMRTGFSWGEMWVMSLGGALGGYLGGLATRSMTYANGVLPCGVTANQFAMRHAITGAVGGAFADVTLQAWENYDRYGSDFSQWHWNLGQFAFQTILGGVTGWASGHGMYRQMEKACFAAGTPLLTPTGDKTIELFREGDQILARDEWDENAPVEVQVVEEVFVRWGRILHLKVRGKIIKTTGEHPFYVKGKKWVAARELKPGDLLSTHDGRWVAVEEVFDTGAYELVYNLRVSQDHTYFVGSREWDFSVWAHNSYQKFLNMFGLKDTKAHWEFYRRAIRALAAIKKKSPTTKSWERRLSDWWTNNAPEELQLGRDARYERSLLWGL
jgi:hypothetical protein